jgi:hypothetical protein
MRRPLKLLTGTLALYASFAFAQIINNPGVAGSSPSVLMITRGDTATTSACDVGIYLKNELAARLMAGESVSFNLPPGETTVALRSLGAGYCSTPMASTKSQSLLLTPGEIKQYRVVQSEQGYYLAPVELYKGQ